MRGEYWPDGEPEHRLLDAVGAYPEGSELAHRPAGGGRLRIRGRSAQIRVSPPDALRLLGSVAKQKEERECTRGHRAMLNREAVGHTNHHDTSHDVGVG